MRSAVQAAKRHVTVVSFGMDTQVGYLFSMGRCALAVRMWLWTPGLSH